MVQWLGRRTSTAGGTGSIPGGGTKIPHAAWYGHKKKKRNFNLKIELTYLYLKEMHKPLKKITRLKFELSTLIFMLIFLLNKQLKK